MPKVAPIYQLRVSLVEIEPEIWRRVLVPADIKLPKLHLVLQAAMGWRNSHLHVFRDGKNTYSPMPEDMFLAQKSVKLSALLMVPGQVLEYEYDMGDAWLHVVEIEQILERDIGKICPFCIDGANDCPPEDCGGEPGYEHLLEVISNAKHPEYRDLKRWMDAYGPEPFDLKAVNRHLSALAPKTRGNKTAANKKPARQRIWVKAKKSMG